MRFVRIFAAAALFIAITGCYYNGMRSAIDRSRAEDLARDAMLELNKETMNR